MDVQNMAVETPLTVPLYRTCIMKWKIKWAYYTSIYTAPFACIR